MSLNHNTPVTFRDFRGALKSGTVVGRKHGDSYWVRTQENLMPGFNVLDRVGLKHRFKLEVVPDFSSYDAWVDEKDIQARDQDGEA